MAVTPETAQRYRKVAGGLAARAARAGYDANEPGRAVALWLADHSGCFRPATLRQYRSAGSAVFGEAFDNEIKKHQLNPAPRDAPKKTSSMKMKRLPYDDLLAIWRNVQHKNHTNFLYFAFYILKFGVLTGLRPSEWSNVFYELDSFDNLFILQVKNAKNTNSRSHGDYRNLFFKLSHDKEFADLQNFIKAVDRLVGSNNFDGALENAARALHRLNQELWPRRRQHVTLYSGRHQACANWKLDRDQYEIAALLGHASVETAGVHYGRRSSGQREYAANGFVTPIPSPEDLSRVKALNPAPPKTRRPSRDCDDRPSV